MPFSPLLCVEANPTIQSPAARAHFLVLLVWRLYISESTPESTHGASPVSSDITHNASKHTVLRCEGLYKCSAGFSFLFLLYVIYYPCCCVYIRPYICCFVCCIYPGIYICWRSPKEPLANRISDIRGESLECRSRIEEQKPQKGFV